MIDTDKPEQDLPTAAAEPSRRGVLGAIAAAGVGVAALASTAALWAAGTWRFLFNNLPNQPPQRFRAGRPEDYPPGCVETRFRDSHGVWLVHGQYRGRWQIFALSTVCTHLGCITLWQADQETFKCPCHGSGFRRDGIQFEGPAPRPLPRLAIRVDSQGYLEVDKGRTFREELGQWADPASYVSV